jgi:hypothetical protein
MTVPSAKPTVQGYYIFSVTPTDGLPSASTGIALNDIAYYDGLSWSLFCKYVDASATITIGTKANNQVVFRKQNGGRISTNGVYGYLRVRCTTNKTITKGSPILFDTTTLIQGDTISYDSTTGIFTLKENSNYEFVGSGGNASNSWVAYQWQMSFDKINWTNRDAGSMILSPSNGWGYTGGNNLANGSINATQPVYLRLITTMDVSSQTIGDLYGDNYFDEYGWASVKEIAKSQSVLIRPQFEVIPQEWTAYTPTIGSVGTGAVNPVLGSDVKIKAIYKVIGKTMQLSFNLFQTIAGTSLGTGVYYISLPTIGNYNIDTNLANIPTNIISSSTAIYNGAECMPLSIWKIVSYSASMSQDCKVIALSNDKIGLYLFDRGTLWGSNGGSWVNVANTNISFNAEIPLV